MSAGDRDPCGDRGGARCGERQSGSEGQAAAKARRGSSAPEVTTAIADAVNDALEGCGEDISDDAGPFEVLSGRRIEVVAQKCVFSRTGPLMLSPCDVAITSD